MIKIGCHISSSDGYMSMARHALSLGADTFAFFTRNPRGGAAKAIDEDDVREFRDFCALNGIGSIVAHSPYTLNPCSSDAHLRDFALETMKDDIRRMKYTPGNFYNFHPGSHTGQGVDKGIEEIVSLLCSALPDADGVTVLLETMSGKGSEVGGNFKELRRIIDGTRGGDALGVCFDTCHIWDAGYDIVNNLDGVLGEFDDTIGLKRLRAVHINDSKNPLGAKKDRHEKLGEGYIGLEALCRVITHPALSSLPFILETPNDDDGYKKEISLLRKLITERISDNAALN